MTAQQITITPTDPAQRQPGKRDAYTAQRNGYVARGGGPVQALRRLLLIEKQGN